LFRELLACHAESVYQPEFQMRRFRDGKQNEDDEDKEDKDNFADAIDVEIFDNMAADELMEEITGNFKTSG
jgi:hypothetical protein